jgi:hypothetical protein
MDKFQTHKLAGAHIFRGAVEYIKAHGWHHNSMDILLNVTPGQVWNQPMAVLMFSELSNELGSETLTAFDKRVEDQAEVIDLFNRVADNLSAG